MGADIADDVGVADAGGVEFVYVVYVVVVGEKPPLVGASSECSIAYDYRMSMMTRFGEVSPPCDREVADCLLLFLLILTYLRRSDPESRPYISTRPV